MTPQPESHPILSNIETLEAYDSVDFPSDPASVRGWWKPIGGQELDGLVSALLVDSFVLEESRLRVDQAAERARQASAARLPSLAGSTDASSTRSASADGSSAWRESFGAGLSVDYSADVFGGLRSTERAAALNFRATELSFRATEQQETALLVRNWVAAATLQRRLDLALATAESFRTTFELTDERYRAGSRNTSASDVQIARQNFDSALVNIPDLRTQLQTQLLEIDGQLARLPGETADEFQGALLLDQQPSLPIGLPADLL
ncbi:MAG: TolC family protein, partial [Pseudomonadota bacterium]